MSRSISLPDSIQLDARSLRTGDGFVPSMLCVFALRALIFGVGLLSLMTATSAMLSHEASGHAWLAYDGIWYQHIAEFGYASSTKDEWFPLIAFFPLYPFTARLLTWFVSVPHALVILSNVCSLVGLGFVFSWMRNLTNPRTAMICTLLVASYPGAVFFSAALTEGPFLMMVAVTFWLLQKRRFFFAAGVCALATLTRPTGAALALTVAVYALVTLRHLPWAPRLFRTALIGLVATSGGLAYEAFLWHRFGAPDAYVNAQASWETAEDASHVVQAKSGGPARGSVPWLLDRVTRPQVWNRIIVLPFLFVPLIGFWKPCGVPRVLFLLPLIIFLMTYLPNNGLRASSIMRYETAGIPVFAFIAVFLARLERRPALVAVLAGSFAIQVYYAVLFSRGIWIG